MGNARSKPWFKTRAALIVLTFAAATMGGAGFYIIGLPSPWLGGSMLATMVLCLAGIRAYVPKAAGTAVFIILGLSIGSSVDWHTLSLMKTWPASLAILTVTMCAVTLVLQFYYRWAYGWDRRTCFFASVPGALSTVVIFAVEYKADVLKVTIVQCVRLAFLVALLPVAVTALGLQSSGGAKMPAPVHSVRDLVIVFAVGAAGGFLFQKLRVPAGMLLGAAASNIALHLGGVVEGSLPSWIMIPTYVLLGAYIGARFSGIHPKMLVESAGAGIKGCLLASGIAVAGAVTVSWMADLPYPDTLLAFAPGGLDAMTIMAFALGADPAYVGVHQIFRFLMMSLAMPLVSIWLKKPAPHAKLTD